jgi:hypothetical protein
MEPRQQAAVTPVCCTSVPERVLDRLGNMLYDAVEILEILRAAEAERIPWVTPIIERLYEDISDVMNTIGN